jgi:glycine cleavage system aminomethyltransferase T/glycine/D-amino acid oxidase-like deaminating enzyme
MAGGQSLPDRAETVVVGAGCVGCSIAYHLTQRGRTDVAVVDMGPIYETGGSTSHAPGGLIQTTSSSAITRFASYTRDLFTKFDAYHPVGSISMAKTERRMEALRRDRDYAASWGLTDTELLTPEEVTEHLPQVDPSAIVGGYYVPNDGVMDSVDATERMGEAARAAGATVHPHTKVVDVELTDGSVRSVLTENGRIETENVVVASNIWAPKLGEKVGIDVPLVPCEHQYAITEPISEFDDPSAEVRQPMIRHQDGGVYLRQHWDAYGIGSYNHEPLVADPANLPDYEDAPRIPNVQNYDPSKSLDDDSSPMPASRQFTEEHFTDAWREVTELLPSLADTEVVEAFNGMFAFTPDGLPILGEPRGTDGLWIATAVHVTHSGGVGKAMAELIDGQEPSIDIRECDVDRFQPHERSARFANARGREVYEHFWTIHHPDGSSGQCRGLRRSPFYDHQTDLSAVFYEGDGWERPRWFESNADLLDEYAVDERSLSEWEASYRSPIEGAEQLVTREGVGLHDLSHEAVLRVSGADAPGFPQSACANDVDVPVGTVTYTTVLTAEGGIKGAAFVVRTKPDRFLVVAGPGSTGSILETWLRDRPSSDDAVEIANETSQWCGIGVWGPDSGTLLDDVTETTVSGDAIAPWTAIESYVAGVPSLLVHVSRVGSDGWELYVPREYGATIWETLCDADRDSPVRPIGDRAFEGLRLEAGYRRWGQDLDTERTPVEANLDATVDAAAGSFVGRDALDERATSETLSYLTIDAPEATVMDKMPILLDDEVVGSVTSADWSYSADTGVAYGYLPNEVASTTDRVTVRYADDRYEATVREGPLLEAAPQSDLLSWSGP